MKRLSILLLLGVASTASAEVVDCTAITALPATITTPGIYCLQTSLSTTGTGTAISIDASDVVLDFNGHSITGAGSGTGVSATNQQGVVVRNGAVHSFVFGISLSSTAPVGACVVEQMLVQNGISGITVTGAGMIVRNDRVQDMGPGTSGVIVTGIFVNGGSTSHVHDNEVTNITGTTGTSPWAIYIFNSPGTDVQRNLVSRVLGSGGSTVYGIIFNNSAGNVANDNRVYGFDHGIAWLSPSTGLYRNNTVGGATTPYSGGVAAGTTNFSF